MLSLYFGNYLVKKNKLTQEELMAIIQESKKESVFLGFTAYISRMLNYEDIIDILNEQEASQRSFEAVCMEKGCLTKDEAADLTARSEEQFYQFLQSLVSKQYFSTKELLDLLKLYKEENHLSNAEMDALQKNDIHKVWPMFIHFNSDVEIEKNLQAYQKDNQLTDAQISALTQNDIEKIMPSFVYQDPIFYNDFLDIVFENISQLITPQIYIENNNTVHEYHADTIAYQTMKGSHHVFLGIVGKEEHTLYIANKYGYTNYTEPNTDTQDALCEFINCINGIFASKSSDSQIPLEIIPPQFCENVTLISKGPIYTIPVWIGTHPIELVISIDTDIEIIDKEVS